MQITLSYAAAGIFALLSTNIEGVDARMALNTRKHSEVNHYQRRSTSKRAPSTMRTRATSDYISGGPEPTARDTSQSQPGDDSPVAGLARTSTATSPNRQSSYSYQWDQPFQMNGLQTPAPPSGVSPGVTGLPLLGGGLGGVGQPSGLTGALPLGQGGLGGIGNNPSPLGVGRLANALPIGGSDMGYTSPLGGALPSSLRNIQSPGDLLGLSSLTSPLMHMAGSPANLPSTSRAEVPLPQQIDGNGFVNANKIDGVLHRIKHDIENKRIVSHSEQPTNAPSSNIPQTTGTQVTPQFEQASSPMQALPPPVRSASSPVFKSQPEGYLSPNQQLAPFVTPVAARPLAPSNDSSEQPQAPAQLMVSQPPQEKATPITQSQSGGSSGQPVAPDVTPVATRPVAPSNSEQPQVTAQPTAAQPPQKQITSPISKKQPEQYISPDQQLSPVTTPIAARPLVTSNNSPEQPQAMPQPTVEQPVQKQMASSPPHNQLSGYLSPEHVVTPVAARPLVQSNTPEQAQATATSAPVAPAQPVEAPSTNASAVPTSKASFVAPEQNASNSPLVNKNADSSEKTPENRDFPVSQSTGRINVPAPPAYIGSQPATSPTTAPQQENPVPSMIASPARAVQGTTAGSAPAGSHTDSYY
ncbi:uncharacterized protein MELLADRAFT_63773 [Melampsora larici-populina 98AG31]|uniref:Uncharacterized protein n=1 Tax=Melampsora larici-populina (strain 98AG31 / pathotype 3-4-7) TaxID=747676 RepID=F4RP34_MELLP|nr:uncharacterized protein MELLADRAFT_63773 [Melampsora larici-populina 98AG31]EGG05750.1 hypothetical protein MELLADRAFT_63773 [Melampsora larici-populina 98AG31]